jgi:hypothetical protein
MSNWLLDSIAAQTALLVPLSSTGDGSGFGIDLICPSDLDPRLAETDTNSNASLSQDLFHRITTPRGGLIDDPDYGIDLRGKLSVGQTPQQIQALQGEIEAECRKDDRVNDVQAVVTVSGARLEIWTITLQVLPLDPASNSFELVLSVTNGQALLTAINQTLS